MTQAIALNAAIAILQGKLVALLGNNATFEMVNSAKKYLEAQMTEELHS